MDRKYKIVYKIDIKPEGVTKEDVPDGDGATDAIAIFSILRGADGGVSYAFATCDGDTGKELSSPDEFKLWTIFASMLSEREDLGPGRREVCRKVVETVKLAWAMSEKIN